MTKHFSNKEPWLSVNLSKMLPGLGQIYSQQPLKGWVLLIGYLALQMFGLWSIFSDSGNLLVGVVCCVIAFLIWLGSLFDAHASAKKLNSAEFEASRKTHKDAWLAVFLTTFLPGLGHLYLGKWLIGLACLVGVITVSTLLPGSLAGLLGLVLAAIAYHAYISAPVHRESSKRAILLFCGLIALLAIAVPNAVTIRNNLAEARYIPSQAMTPTLQVGDRVLVDKVSYRTQAPQRGDIVVFMPPDEASIVCGGGITSPTKNLAYIKRVVGLPNETIEIKQRKLYVKGRPISESYTQEAPDYTYGPRQVPENAYFVLGDNRNNSCDSHYWGFVPRENIIGRASKIFFPFDRIQSLKAN